MTRGPPGGLGHEQKGREKQKCFGVLRKGPVDGGKGTMAESTGKKLRSEKVNLLGSVGCEVPLLRVSGPVRPPTLCAPVEPDSGSKGDAQERARAQNSVLR